MCVCVYQGCCTDVGYLMLTDEGCLGDLQTKTRTGPSKQAGPSPQKHGQNWESLHKTPSHPKIQQGSPRRKILLPLIWIRMTNMYVKHATMWGEHWMQYSTLTVFKVSRGYSITIHSRPLLSPLYQPSYITWKWRHFSIRYKSAILHKHDKYTLARLYASPVLNRIIIVMLQSIEVTFRYIVFSTVRLVGLSDGSRHVQGTPWPSSHRTAILQTHCWEFISQKCKSSHAKSKHFIEPI